MRFYLTRLVRVTFLLFVCISPIRTTAESRRTGLNPRERVARGRADGDMADAGRSDDALSAASSRAKEKASQQRVKGIRTRTRKRFARWRELPFEESVVTMCWNGPAEGFGGVAVGQQPVNGSFREASASHNIVVTGANGTVK